MDLLLALSASLEPEHPVTIGTMFRSPAIRSGNTVVAFLGHGETLIVKVSAERAEALVAEGSAERVTMGSRTMREWIVLPAAENDTETLEQWIPRTQEALRYVSAGYGSPPRDV